MYTYKDKQRIDELVESFNLAILTTHGKERYPNSVFISPMIHLNWFYDGAVDIRNNPGDISKINYNLKLKLLISSCINTKKTENIKNNPYVSVLLAKTDLQGVHLTCGLRMNIWGEAHIYENGEMENIWNRFFKVADTNVKNFFYPGENGICIIVVESKSCKLIDNGELWK